MEQETQPYSFSAPQVRRALMLAPLAAPVATTLGLLAAMAVIFSRFTVSDKSDFFVDWSALAQVYGAAAGISTVVAYALTPCYAAGLLAIARRRKHLPSLGGSASCGALGGIAPCLLLSVPMVVAEGRLSTPAIAWPLFGALAGGAVGVAFWRILAPQSRLAT